MDLSWDAKPVRIHGVRRRAARLRLAFGAREHPSGRRGWWLLTAAMVQVLIDIGWVHDAVLYIYIIYIYIYIHIYIYICIIIMYNT